MRRVRWKSKYLTGDRRADERNKRLVTILRELEGALRAKEHCQDMEDLYGALVEVTGNRLSGAAAGTSGVGSDDAVRDLIRSSLPLEALHTPACRDCDLCELTEERVTAWLELAKVSRQPDEAAAA